MFARLFIALLLCASVASAARIAILGGETGDVTELSSSSGATAVSSPVNTGGHAYKVTGTSSSASRTFSGISEVWGGFYFQLNSIATTRTIVEIINGGVLRATFRVTSSGFLDALVSGGTRATGTTVLSVDTWYFVETRFKKGTGANAIAEIRLNEVVEATSSDGTVTGDADTLRFTANPGFILHIDDIRIDDAAYPGEGVVEVLRPNGNPSGDDDFVIVTGASETNKWEVVDDDPVDNSKYLEFTPSTAGDQELDLSTVASVGTINATKSAVVGNRSGGGATTFSIRSQDSDESPQNSFNVALASGSFDYFENIDTTPPANQTELDRWQTKFTKSSGGQDMDISEFWLMVDRTAAVGGDDTITIFMGDD